MITPINYKDIVIVVMTCVFLIIETIYLIYTKRKIKQKDDKMIVIRDVAPAAPVHVLMIPKAHTENIITAEPELLLYMFGKVKELAEKLGVNEKGFRIVANTGDDGGQTVKHLHIHLLGGKALGWPPC